jgi:NADPH:quinone reductase-like Zn-dependent oxidoreductase
MRAVWLERNGGPEVLRVTERPEPKAGAARGASPCR